MLELTRRRSTDARQECWHIRYGDLHAGTIAIRSGNPHDAKIHGSGAAASMGEHQSDTAATFEDARADFERAWLVFYQTAPTPIFRHGAMSGGLDRTEIRAAGSRQGPGAAELWAGQARPSIPQVPLRRGLRHARAGGGADARSAHHGHLNYTSRGTAPRWVSGATEGRGRAGHRTRGNGNPNHQPGFFALVPFVPATF